MSQEKMSQKVNSIPEGNAIQASFQQKSAGISLFIIGSTALYYFAQAWPLWRNAPVGSSTIPDGYASLVLTTLGLIILAEILLQIVLVIGAGSAAKPTARDSEAALKATRNAYAVFVVGVLAMVGLLFVGFSAFSLANVAMMSLLLAETIRFASQLFYGRRVVQGAIVQKGV